MIVSDKPKRPADNEIHEMVDAMRFRMMNDILDKIDYKMVNDLHDYFEKNVDPEVFWAAIEEQVNKDLEKVKRLRSLIHGK